MRGTRCSTTERSSGTSPPLQWAISITSIVRRALDQLRLASRSASPQMQRGICSRNSGLTSRGTSISAWCFCADSLNARPSPISQSASVAALLSQLDREFDGEFILHLHGASRHAYRLNTEISLFDGGLSFVACAGAVHVRDHRMSLSMECEVSFHFPVVCS